MKIWSDSFKHGEPIPARCAFGEPNPQTHVELSDNKNPHLAWSDLPAGTKSLVVICHDPDVPSKADDVNQEGKTVPASLPRVDFYHWVLVDLPPSTAAIAEGEFSSGITATRQAGAAGTARHTAGREQLHAVVRRRRGDARRLLRLRRAVPAVERQHRAPLSLHPLRDRFAALSGGGTVHGPRVLAAIAGHILGQASIVGTYVMNPSVK